MIIWLMIIDEWLGYEGVVLVVLVLLDYLDHIRFEFKLLFPVLSGRNEI